MLKIAICANEIPGDEQLWIDACNDIPEKVSYEVISLTANDWLEKVKSANADWYVFRPGAFSEHFKQLYDERVLIMQEELGLNLFPSRKEIFIYENKRFLSFWLMANQLPHPKTDIFYHEDEALQFLDHVDLPVVGKTNIGASGSGVTILKTREEAKQYTRDIFSGKGAKKKVGPNLQKGNLAIRAIKMLFNPPAIKKRLNVYKTISQGSQTRYAIFQAFTPHDHEWRVVRIGDSFFAHKKLRLGEKASGSLEKNYDTPPLNLFDFVKKVTDKHHLYSQAIDVFESGNGGYLINEMQCIFGQSDAYQMKVEGVIGRYRYLDGEWTFESGDFNRNQSYSLRVEHLINNFENEYEKTS